MYINTMLTILAAGMLVLVYLNLPAQTRPAEPVNVSKEAGLWTCKNQVAIIGGTEGGGPLAGFVSKYGKALEDGGASMAKPIESLLNSTKSKVVIALPETGVICYR